MREMEALLKSILNRSELANLVQRMIRADSCGIDGRYEKEVAQVLKTFFDENGIRSEIREIGNNRYNLVGQIKGRFPGKRILLTGHLDTVGDYGIPGLFDGKETDGIIHGRGACDMKGPIGAMAYGMAMLKRAALLPDHDVEFAFVADEEMRSLGTEKLIEDGLKADFAVLGEPTDMHICVGNRGLEWLDVVIFGKGSHGGTSDQGINAVDMASHFITKVRKDYLPKLAQRRHEILGSSTMNIGAIRGGFQASTVPEECVISIDRRWIPGESTQQLYSEYEQLLEELANEHEGFRGEVRRNLTGINKLEHVPFHIDREHFSVRMLEEHIYRVKGEYPEKKAFQGWTDGSLLSHFGKIPTVIFGPGNIADAHSKNEKIAVKDLEDAALIYGLTALKW